MRLSFAPTPLKATLPTDALGFTQCICLSRLQRSKYRRVAACKVYFARYRSEAKSKIAFSRERAGKSHYDLDQISAEELQTLIFDIQPYSQKVKMTNTEHRITNVEVENLHILFPHMPFNIHFLMEDTHYRDGFALFRNSIEDEMTVYMIFPVSGSDMFCRNTKLDIIGQSRESSN